MHTTKRAGVRREKMPGRLSQTCWAPSYQPRSSVETMDLPQERNFKKNQPFTHQVCYREQQCACPGLVPKISSCQVPLFIQLIIISGGIV